MSKKKKRRNKGGASREGGVVSGRTPEIIKKQAEVQEAVRAENAEEKQKSVQKPEQSTANLVREKDSAAEQEKQDKADETIAAVTPVPLWKRRLKIGLGVAALILMGFYISGIVYFHGKFLVNTSINGIDTAYLTVEEAEELIRSNVEDYEILLKERNGESESITGKDIDYHYVSNGEIRKFWKSQAYAFWFVNYFRPVSWDFDTAVVFDEDLLKKKVNSLNCFDKAVEEAPTDARMVFRSTKYEIQKEKQGCKVKKEKLLTVLAEAISDQKKTVNLEKENCYEVPKVTSDDKALNELTANMNHYADIEITYCFGDNREVLNGRVIKDWLTYDKSGKVFVKDGAISDYIASLAEKYDTYDKPRRFKTTDGTYVTVEGGSYGWKLDQAAEAEEITKLMEQEPHIERTPLFAQTANSWENGDMGDTYVEVDLTKQHLWMYIDGNLIVESDFVSGKMTQERRTPPGTYTLYYKKSPAVLKSNKPGDSYESPVTFWMPFNGGIGFHDSSWRGSYGGQIFWNSGSHGCINLPYSAAKTIYQNIEKGFPVICFYRNGEYK